jgi:HEPN domain-containing protein
MAPPDWSILAVMSDELDSSAVWSEIFPSERDTRWVQTEWGAGWGAAAHGFGRTAEFLTEHRADFHAEIDQAGLAIFYLQRHRVELLIKALLDQLHKPIPRTHRLDVLWGSLKGAVRLLDPGTESYLSQNADGVIRALNAADESSMAFRYPVDKTGKSSSRPDYVDLSALQKYVDRFDEALTGAATYLAELTSESHEL